MVRGDAGLVGREQELEQLEHALDRLLHRDGGLCLLAGEGGIGKSRLCEALAERARRRDVFVAWGRCLEAGGAPAYWPWIQVLRSLRNREPSAPWLACYGATLAPLLPELGAPAAAAALTPEQARFVLLDGVCAALGMAASERPLLVVVEDLHLADAASLSVLDLLSVQARGVPLLVVGTLRDAAIHAAHETLARLMHQGSTLALDRLAEASVRAYLEHALGPQMAVHAARVHALTEGHPLMLVECARLIRSRGIEILAQWGAALDGGLGQILRARIAVVSPRTHAVLEVMSVWGREASQGAIAATDGAPAEDIALAVREAVDASLVTEVGEGCVRFSHILTREALYRDLTPARRESLHARAATVLQTQSGSSVAALGHHLRAAGPVHRVRALEVTVQEARAAMVLCAFDLATERFEQAAALHRSLHVADERGLAGVWLELGRAQLHAGKIEAGRAHCLRAAQTYRDRADAQGLAEAALGYGVIMQFARVDPVLVGLLEQAERALDAGGSPLRARVLARLAAAIQPSHDAQVAVRLAHRAIAMARDLSDERLLLEVLRAAGAALVDVVDVSVTRPIDAEHAALAERLGEPEHALRAHLRLAFDEFAGGDLASARAALRVVVRHARALRHPLFAWYEPAVHGMLALYEGRADAAEVALQALEGLERNHTHANRSVVLCCQRARWARLVGDADLHAEIVAELPKHFADSPVSYAMGRVLVAWERLYAGGPETSEFALLPAELDLILGVADHTALPLFAEVAAHRGDTALALRLQGWMAQLGHRHGSPGVMTMCWDGPMDHVRALIAATLGDHAAAERHFEAALAAALAHDAHPAAARVLLAWARAARDGRGYKRAPIRVALAQLELWRAEPAVVAATLALGSSLADDHGSGSEVAVPEATPDLEFRLLAEGEHWRLSCGGHSYALRDTKGVRWLAALLAEPGRSWHVLWLSNPAFDSGAGTGDAGEVLDRNAIEAYRDRLSALDATLEEAQDHHDFGRAEALAEEREQLLAQLASGVGLGGRGRRVANAAERARVNVQRRLKDAIRRIGHLHPRLGDHLSRSIRTGIYCVYDPDISRARVE